MHIAVLCATNRGYRCAERLMTKWGGPGRRFTIFSFRETPWEPPYLDSIASLARQHGQAFHQTRDVAHPKWDAFWRDAEVDLLFLISWRYMIPAAILRRPRLGAYVLHDSLLPKYRGFAPTVWAMINGERETGVTLFEAVEALDAGDIIDQRAVAIAEDDAIAEVVENVTLRYLEMLDRNMPALLAGGAKLMPQDHSAATYTAKWTPADARIDWRKSARQIYNLIRATTRPYPGAFTTIDGRKLTIWSAAMPATSRRFASHAPGRVVERLEGVGCAVLTGDGVILVKEAQFEGEAPVTIDMALKSYSLTLGR